MNNVYTSSSIIRVLERKPYNLSRKDISLLVGCSMLRIIDILKGKEKLSRVEEYRVVKEYPELSKSMEGYKW